jgi:Homeodomain-like domain
MTMAHPDHIKAQALALLVLGNTPRYVAKQLGIPRTTVRRWQIEARTWARELLGPALADALAAIGGCTKMALKKGSRAPIGPDLASGAPEEV